MKEVKIENNPLELKVFINGVPNLNLIPKIEADIAIAALEVQIAESTTTNQRPQKTTLSYLKN